MLEVLDEKIRSGGVQRMRTLQLDLGRDPIPESRYHLIVANMVLHHVDQTETLLAAFHEMLLPGGAVAIADLDTESGLFHGPDVAASVFHHGFDRYAFKDRLCWAGFVDVKDVTAHVIRKSIAGGEIRDFPVFLIGGHRP
jgi:ubiquinone/menaquinone biosynthesis C-methylase UbiE